MAFSLTFVITCFAPEPILDGPSCTRARQLVPWLLVLAVVFQSSNRCRSGPCLGLGRGQAMTSRGTPSRFLRSVLHNGVGRYVGQLKRLSIIFSRNGQSSLGVR